MERKMAVESDVSEGFLDKVKSVIGIGVSDGRGGDENNGEERRTSDYSLINEEAMQPQERAMFERIQLEKAQSELLNTVHQHIAQNGGDLDAEKAVEVLAKGDLDVDVRSLTIGGTEEESGDQGKVNDEGILDKMRNVAKQAIGALSTESDERKKSEDGDEGSRRSSSGIVDEENMSPEERAHFEKIKKEKEQSELLNKAQKKKIRTGEETFDPVKAQDDLRRQESVKNPVERKLSKRGKSVEQKQTSRPRKDSEKTSEKKAEKKKTAVRP